MCSELETHVKCDIRESEKCLYRSKVSVIELLHSISIEFTHYLIYFCEKAFFACKYSSVTLQMLQCTTEPNVEFVSLTPVY